MIIAQRGPGELVGEMAAPGGHRRTASAVALETAEIGLVPASDFKRFLTEHPDGPAVDLRRAIGQPHPPHLRRA